MKLYEAMIIIQPDLEPEQVEALVGKFQSLISDNGGRVDNTDMWGKRKLAYPIRHKTEGIYVVMDFAGEPAVIRELERVLRITDGVIRHVLVSQK